MTGRDAQPVVVRLGERAQNPDGSFQVRVSFGDSAEYDVTVSDPADAAGEARLAWYFEQHLRYPFLDKDLEQDAVQRIAAYGETLFTQVFGGAASHDYRRLRDRAFDECRIEVSGSTGLHRLHWEAMRDPDLPVPLAVRLPVTRRVETMGSKLEPPAGRPTLNILVVVARPGGPKDVGYRTISRPLLDALRTAGVPVTVDLVRPGTWQALRDHLRAATEEHGSGWYQVAHFDLHGAFSQYAPLEQARQEERLQFTSGALTPFEGRRGFLFFETDHDGKAGPVAAEEVAGLLAEHRVPIAVLNACQSAMQDDSEAGLAQRLAEAGVPVTVGMAYSVTVSAAEQAMPVLYGRIADAAGLTTAVHAARRDLHDRKARRAYFGQMLDLEDWVLPVMFAQHPLHITLRPMTGPEQADFFDRSAAVGDEPATEYGFVGRDLDVQAIEHRVLAGKDTNQLLVRGMAGAGKTTLLAHLAWWWQRTGLVAQVFRFSYEDRAWTASQIIRDIRSGLLSPAEHAQADSMSEQAQAEQVAQLLRATRHLLILDNTESITAAPAAIPHALTQPERDKLRTFLSKLRGGRTLVLLGSREPETWLTTASTGPRIYPLPGLDPQAASTLVERILHRHGATRHLANTAERGALQELVTLLGGYPLPLTVVLPVLATASPSAVLAELKSGGPGADPAGLISRAIEYSHGKLNPALQNSLLLLAPFTAVIPAGFLDTYRDLLQEHEAVQALGSLELPAALNQVITLGLAAPHPQLGYLVQVQPVLPWFLRSRLHGQPQLHAAAAQAHYQLYREVAAALVDMFRTPDPQEHATGQVATRAEYANLTAALNHGLQTGQPIDSIILALDDYLRQSQQHDTRRQLLDAAIAAYAEPGGQRQQRELAYLHEFAGLAAYHQHRLDAAKAHDESAIQLLDAAGDRQRQGMLYGQLANIAERQRQHGEAEASYRKALDIFLEYGDQDGTSRVYHSLGMLAQGQHRYGEAETNYRKALDIRLESGDQHSAAAITYHQLGILAQQQHRYGEAETNYRKALDIKLEYGDQHSAAITYHQLGTLAEIQHRYGEAETNYRKALDIKLEYGDQHSAAITYHQLGTLAEIQHRYGEAETNYRKALDIKLEYGDQHSAAITYHQLGTLAEIQHRYGEAETNYRKALDIHRETDPRSASGTATQLGLVLAALGRHTEAVRTLVYAAVSWHRETGQWDESDLRHLHRERAVIGTDDFIGQLNGDLPADTASELVAALEAAGGDIGDAEQPGTEA